ncbi:MAG: nicotinate (nicotinamide) nucleotide adenylyltransferase [Ruminococcaceae bacterium]|nr:nicotinate (nicotinamide) nucleotide adenylyltransferase [Oscillospiraceae bacterium]
MSLTAIFGGTFNPFHKGHYEMLNALNECKAVSKILVMPDKIPPHKEVDFLATDDDRFNMCKIAAADFNKAEVCDIEFKRQGKSYTYDTVKLLKEIFPNDNLAFVCGGDMLVYFDKWYKYEELMKMLPFIVFSRTSTENTEFLSCIEKFKNMGMQIILMDNEISNISSTDFRNFPAAKLLPEKIYNYIKERGLYGV